MFDFGGIGAVETVQNIPVYANAVQLLACGIGCAAFTFMFGGHLPEALYAFL